MKPRFRYTKTATRTLNRSSKQRAPSEILEYVLPRYDIVKFGPKGSFWGICIENTPQERFLDPPRVLCNQLRLSVCPSVSLSVCL